MRIIHGHPLKALVDQFERNTEQARELWIASAFVDAASVSMLKAARPAGCSVRFLTGTYGKATRNRTFRSLVALAKQGSISARIWDCGAHGQLHAKLYIWRQGQRGVAWIGSSNFTETGLRDQGELVAEVCGTWDSPEIRSMRSAFEREWAQPTNKALDEKFLRGYREAPRVPPAMTGTIRRRPGTREMGHSQTARVMWVPLDVSERVAKRVDTALGPNRREWTGRWLLWGRNGMTVRPGDKLLVARSKTEYSLAEAREPVQHGRSRVAVPYEPLRGCAELPMTKAVLGRWVDEGILDASKTWYRSRSLSQAQWDAIVRLARKKT